MFLIENKACICRDPSQYFLKRLPNEKSMYLSTSSREKTWIFKTFSYFFLHFPRIQYGNQTMRDNEVIDEKFERKTSFKYITPVLV